MTDDQSFLQHYGGLTRNSLIEIINSPNNELSLETNEPETIIQSSYYDLITFFNVCNQNCNKFSILSTNAESVNAKFGELTAFIHMLNEKSFKFSAICFQECWLSNHFDMSLLHLDGYHCIYQYSKTCSTKGGTIIYLSSDFEYELILNYDSSIKWEGLFINVYGGGLLKNIKIGNIDHHTMYWQIILNLLMIYFR